MRRVTAEELLDDDRGTPQEIAQSFDDLWRINRWLGGLSNCLTLLERVFAQRGTRAARILDVGAGDARLAQRLGGELSRRGIQAQFVALDRRITHLRNGQSKSLPAVAADVFRLPFAENSFDVVMCNLFLHHFSGKNAVDLLKRLMEVARDAVIINDLERSLLPYMFIRAAFPFARSRITRFDGPASVRQAYTRDEMLDLARSAGFRQFRIERMGAYRLGMTIWKSTNGVHA
jgi:SAM-dependent methyltransferase